MPYQVISGNIFTTKCQTIVNTINCVGVMGAGIALECRLRYPDMYKRYIDLCKDKRIDIGLLWLYKSNEKWILNFPTKKHWKLPSKKEYLTQGLEKFMATYKPKGIQSVAFPLLGADRGGINPDESLEILERYLKDIPILVEIYKYNATAHDDLYNKTKDWILLSSETEIERTSGLQPSYIKKLKQAVRDEAIVQLGQLAKVDGIGIKTLEKIFAVSAQTRQPDSSRDTQQMSLL